MKRALLMGASQWFYPGVTDMPGLVEGNVLLDYRTLTRVFGFDEIRCCTNNAFTKPNCINKLKWITDVTGPGDVAYISALTHGGLIDVTSRPDWAQPAEDTKETTWITIEPDPFADPLLGYEIGSIVRTIHPEATTFFMFGGCHAGGGLRSFDDNNNLKMDRVPMSVPTPKEYLTNNIDTESWDEIFNVKIEGSIINRDIINETRYNEIIYLGATSKESVAWAGYICGGFYAYMNFFYHQILTDYKGSITYRDLYNELIVRLDSVSPPLYQVPQLECKNDKVDRLFLR